LITQSPSIQPRDDEPLWRFAKLPAFLALLEGNLSLPALAHLQKDDPEEGNVFVNIAPDGAPVVDLSTIEDWLERKATVAEQSEIQANRANNSYPPRTFVEIYKRELAERCCIWCWHRDPDNNQSRAMWHIYADRGIATRSDLATKPRLNAKNPSAHLRVRLNTLIRTLRLLTGRVSSITGPFFSRTRAIILKTR
jgi:hypothetical protein